MSFFAGILSVLVILDCLALIMLVLMQLPKKDAGAGMAFGGAAADALFGAGSGNFLTQATKYATIVFFVLALGLGQVETRLHASTNGAEFEKKLQQQQSQPPPMTQQTPASPAAPAPAPSATTSSAMPTNAFQLVPITTPATPTKATPATPETKATPAGSGNAPVSPAK